MSRLSAAVMSHPRRGQAAAALARRLAGARVVTDPDPGDAPSPLKTALHAWRAVEPGATHHLVVQDDVELSDGFLRRVTAGITLFPDSAIACYANWNSVNGAAARLAAAAGATWATETGAEYFPTLAMVLPARHIDAYLEFAAPFARLWRDDDEVMREFLSGAGIGAVLSVPSLVQHGTMESLAGNVGHGIRRAACFAVRAEPDGTREALAHSIAGIPWLKAGRVLAMVRDTGGEYLRRPWPRLLDPVGPDAAWVRRRFEAFVGSSGQLGKARENLGDMLTYSLWLTAYLMGSIVRDGGVPVQVLADGAVPRRGARIGLDTLAAGAIVGTVIPPRLVRSYRSETTDLAEHGFATGLGDSPKLLD
jgi:hypothetical protein